MILKSSFIGKMVTFPIQRFGSLFPLAIVILSFMWNHTECSHQGWWQKTSCPCKPHVRQPLGRAIFQLFRGLFVKPIELNRLPVIKPDGQKATGTYVGNTIPMLNKKQRSCCDTEYAFEVYNHTTITDKRLKVVHFENAFQFVPTGVCPKNKKCGQGKCIQKYRHHWLLVWDESLRHYPPVTFVPVEIPSHCECVNIGI